MPFALQHVLVSEQLFPETHESGGSVFFTVSAQGEFDLLYPGLLVKQVEATVRHSMRVGTPETTVPDPPGGIDQPGHPHPHPPGPPHPLHNGVTVTVEGMTIDFRIHDPHGQLFTREEVTLADLKKFRDLRGTPVGRWRYTITGQSRVYTPSAALNESVTDPRGVINLGLLETVVSTSAPPLVARAKLDGSRFLASFDLNRVGNFQAVISSTHPLDPWQGSMRLRDPDGATIASTTSRQLRCPIPLSMLGRSRDAAGNPRLWTLEVSPPGGVIVGDQFVTATVLGEGRIGIAALQDRIQKLVGPRGSFIQLVGENSNGQARAMLTITDVVAAETLDMHGLLDSRLKKEGQSTDIEAGKPIILFHQHADFDYGLSLDVGTVKLRSIDIEIGPGRGLGAATPVIRLIVQVDGSVKVKWEGLTLAEARVRDGKVEMEVGLRIDPDGTPRIVQWVPDEPFDIDMNEGVVAALVLALGVIGGVSAVVITEYVEEIVNERFAAGARDLFNDPSLAPTILMTIFGAHLTYLAPRFEGADILFEHVAPTEPDPKPRQNYAGGIGRMVLEVAAGHPTFHPPTLGDTWKADNLKSKIDHIVVVMMENRSYDHVLGYRAHAPISDGADGLTPELIAAVDAAAVAVQPLPTPEPGSDPLPAVHPLRKAKFAPNAIGLMTRIPKGIGHELNDVRRQLAGQVDGPDGRRINDPRGFMEDFRDTKLGGNPDGADGCTPFTVLGYYEKNEAEQANDLPITAFLAEHYAYCDRYFCSHPGPTLPNRMYSLTGDVQYDRLGVPILDNNHGDNFLLSRAPTIYDLLTRKGVSWRIYESNPSVTMLRMFARYATDDVNIRPLDQLAVDVAAGDLPSLTVVEPAMHHHPEDDDHPDADMYRGQHFLRRVYEALRSNSTTWARTLLIITYDEHGGLYDHVIPPIADVLNSGRPDVAADPAGTTAGSSDGDGAVGGHGGVIAGSPGTTVGHSGGFHTVAVDSSGPIIGSSGGAGAGTGDGTAGGGPGPATSHGLLGGFHLSPEALSVVLGDAVVAEPAATLEVPYGVRVPTFVVSPWVTPGKGPDMVLDHCSIIKTVLARFCSDEKPFLSDRIRASHSFEDFIKADQPMPDPGPPPDLQALPITARRLASDHSQIVTPPLYRKRMRNERVDFHDLSGRLARMLGR